MKWKAEAWKWEISKAQLCSDFFTPEGNMGYCQGHLWIGPVLVSRICPDSEECEQIPQWVAEVRGRGGEAAYPSLPMCHFLPMLGSLRAMGLGKRVRHWNIPQDSSLGKQGAAGWLGEVTMTSNCQLFGVKTDQSAHSKSQVSSFKWQVVFIFSFGFSESF